ncbi:protection of telomeres protein 1 isoform X1 [Hydra vulgaris]|uniref:Protection of telomeres protein 1 isoform X1 n=1 Tax=Hydra vulgaris TaxID=6087 RepID=A0ABM4D3E0_HYDVU
MPKKLYEYTNVADLNVSLQSANIFGIVKYFRPPVVVEKTGDYNAQYTIIDPSVGNNLQSGVRCNLFGKGNTLPDVQVGDIVRFHRLKVDQFNGRLQLKTTIGFSWLVFNESTTHSSHPKVTISKEDYAKVKELRNWYESIKHKLVEVVSLTSETKLCNIKPESFFKCVVYVIRVVPLVSNTCCLLTVTDGSKVCYSSFRRRGLIELELSPIFKQYCFDICVFGELVNEVLPLTPGSIVNLDCVHAKNVPPSIVDTVQKELNLIPIAASHGWIELTLPSNPHSCNGFKVLSKDDERANKLTKEIHDLRAILDIKISKANEERARPLQESLTITDFPLNPFKTLEEVKSSNVPNKFRLRVKIIAVKPSKIQECIVGICGTCDQLVQFNDTFLKEIAFNDTMQCINCKNDLMNITYAFEILVLDSTGLLQVNVFDKEAHRFFNNVKPSLLLRDENIRLNYENKLKRICNEGKSLDYEEELPWVEICVCSFHSISQPNHPRYSLFGTSLI